MKNRSLILLLFALLPFTQALSQAQTPSPSSQKTPAEDVLRVTTNLVQLDVVVTDKEGNHVTDLHPEDFEIVEDKDKRQITSFSYVTLGPSITVSQPTLPNTGRSKPGTAPIVPAPLRPDQVHRTIALVVDDLGLSFESTVSKESPKSSTTSAIVRCTWSGLKGAGTIGAVPGLLRPVLGKVGWETVIDGPSVT